jgi:ketosteroid isomerase-like protein
VEIMKTLSCLLICAMLAASALASDATPLTAQRTALEHARLAQNAAIVRHDIEAIAAVWTDDVTICRGLGTQLAGKAAYRQLFSQDIGSPTEIVYQRHPTAIEVSELWPLAFESGLWEGHQGNATGKVVVRGRYSAQWVKRGDAWLIRSEVFVALHGAGAGLEMKAVP